MVYLKGKLSGKVFGTNHQPAIGTRSRSHERGKTDGSRHYETVVIVGMLADQVDPAGCAKYCGLGAENFREFLRQTFPRQSHLL
jgi:hypothetical protein